MILIIIVIYFESKNVYKIFIKVLFKLLNIFIYINYIYPPTILSLILSYYTGMIKIALLIMHTGQ